MGVAEYIAEGVDAALTRKQASSLAIELAGLAARLTVDESLTSAVFAPLEHLQTEEDPLHPPVLCITAVRMETHAARVLGLPDLPTNGIVAGCDGKIVHLQRHSAGVLDRVTGSIRAMMSPMSPEPSDRAKPLLLLLSIFCADREIDLLHGGLVSLEGKGILLAGKSGCGKSTVALASLMDGLDYLGDDCVAVKRTRHGFEGYSLFGSGCLERAHLANFCPLTTADSLSLSGKTVFPVTALRGGQMSRSTRVRAVVLPRIAKTGEVSLRSIRRQEALLALAPSSILKRAVPASAALSRMSLLVRQLPCYSLEMGPIDKIGECLRGLIRELG